MDLAYTCHLWVQGYLAPTSKIRSREAVQAADTDLKDIADTSGNCGSSFSVTIVSPDFAKKLPLARHKIGQSWVPLGRWTSTLLPARTACCCGLADNADGQ